MEKIKSRIEISVKAAAAAATIGATKRNEMNGNGKLPLPYTQFALLLSVVAIVRCWPTRGEFANQWAGNYSLGYSYLLYPIT